MDYLQLVVLKEVNNQIKIGHSGYHKIISFITQNYYWSGFKKMIQHYIPNYYFYRYAKALRDKYNDLLKPLSIQSRSWKKIILDFLPSLPISNSYNIVLILINYLIK